MQLKPFISREGIATRVKELAEKINRDLAGEPVLLVPILKGATVFAAELAGHLQLETSMDCIGVASYGKELHSNREPKLTRPLSESVAGRNVLIIEDILDSGYTLNFVTTLLRSQKPKSLRVVALLDKPSRRLVPFVADYVGFKIEDNFVVGYGMDWNEKYRELPEIYVFAQGIAAGEI